MIIVCHNCGYEFNSRDYPNSPHNIELCPKCGAPFIRDGLGIAWTKGE